MEDPRIKELEEQVKELHEKNMHLRRVNIQYYEALKKSNEELERTKKYLAGQTRNLGFHMGDVARADTTIPRDRRMWCQYDGEYDLASTVQVPVPCFTAENVSVGDLEKIEEPLNKSMVEEPGVPVNAPIFKDSCLGKTTKMGKFSQDDMVSKEF